MDRERIPSNIYPSSESETDNGGQTPPRPKQTDLGKRVVYYSGNDKKTKYGTLRYWGKPEFSTHGPYRGTWCGIELDEATGKNNGSIQGIRYFHCPPQCGIFVQLNKVELDPNGELKIRARTKTSVTSLVEKKAARKDSKYNEPPPFFYNTMPRSTSVSALNLCETSSNTKYSNRQGGAASSRLSPNHSPNHKPHPSPAVPLTSSSSTRLTPHATMGDSRQYSPKKRSFSHHSAPQLKKHSSEMNIFQRTSPRTSPIHVTQSSTYKPIKGVGGGRSKLCSYSETSSSPVLSSSVPTFNKTPLLTSTSCQDLSQLSPIKKLSVSSRRFSKKLSPDSTLLVSPPPSTIDSEDGVSYYSSTSDLSDTDLTPRSSSNSPCFLDVNSTNVPVILKPPSPPSPPSVSKTPAKSPTHKISLPTGLATPTSTLIESSRSSGAGNGECRVPSPDHQRISKIYLNSKNGRSTLDHPLVNGQAADKENKCINSNEVFVCPSSGQEMPTVTNPSTLTTEQTMDLIKLQNDVKTCLKQQAAMESRLSQMEDRLIQFQSLFMSTMEQVQETLKKQMEYNEGRKIHHHDNQGTWNNI